ncbi:tRNA pseudouridine(38-40) synthase TruA [Vulgatibacter sp.]|uniref:tRNA pseudouridine(38-40) synthase TruA n=1 Tax=Vulgatibacter sp. TaxID=1971226 RepID=UPI00356A71EA
MRTVKLTVEYDGTDFVGWQVQPNGRSVQQVIEQALETMLKERTPVVGAGRTDAGVHAAAQVCSLRTERTVPLKAFVMGLNSLLPPDVAVRAAEEMPEGFHARHSAGGKRYVYRISNRPTRSPLLRRTHWEVYRPLDVGAMREAARHFLGEHDFAAFRAADCPAKTTRRVMRRFDVEERDGSIAITVEATAFLKQMVRNLVGTLVEVGMGKRAPDSIRLLLLEGDRTKAGPTAPPQGLTMDEVFYGGR